MLKKGLHVDPLLQSNLYLPRIAQCWLKHIQNTHFSTEMAAVENKEIVHNSSSLKSLKSIRRSILQIAACVSVVDIDSLTYPTDLATLSFYMANTPWPICWFAPSLLHAGPTLLATSLTHQYHIVGGRRLIRSITRNCVTCRKFSTKPQSQMLATRKSYT